MMKITIICLAICLISVHGFVKRDSESKDPMGDSLKSGGMKQAMDPQNIKKQLDEKMDNLKNKLKSIVKRGVQSGISTSDIEKALDPKNIQKQLDDQMKDLKKKIDDMGKKLKP